MIIGIPSTGSAGLINTVAAFSRKAIVVGVLGTIATAGWVVQGVGHAFYYRQVSHGSLDYVGFSVDQTNAPRFGRIIMTLVIRSPRRRESWHSMVSQTD